MHMHPVKETMQCDPDSRVKETMQCDQDSNDNMACGVATENQ